MLELPVAQPGPVYAPVTTLMMYLTEDCPLRCRYCFVAKNPRKMSSLTAQKAVEFFLSRAISGVEPRVNITFFGGEPFLELDRMEEVIVFATQLGKKMRKRVSFAATTSGVIAGLQAERLLRTTQMSLLVSLDGTREGNRQRPFLSGRDSYEVVARNLPKLVEWASDVTVRMTFTPENLDLLSNVRHVFALGAPWIALCPVLEHDWTLHQPALEAAYDELMSWFAAELRDGRTPALDGTWGLIWQIDQSIRFRTERPKRPCQIATGLLAVDTSGNIMPCHRFLNRREDWLGSVESTTLAAERWKYVHLASRDLLGCDGCIANQVCGGGCRVVVLSGGGGLNDVNPAHCITLRAHYKAALRVYQELISERNPTFLEVLSTHKIRTGALAELSQAG